MRENAGNEGGQERPLREETIWNKMSVTAECFSRLFSYTSGEEEIPILDYKDSPTHDTEHWTHEMEVY